jgi:hypothetical protein
MKPRETKSEAGTAETGILEGTDGIGYWDFRREFCKQHGWQLRRTAPRTYDVLNSEKKKIGRLISGTGYFAAK